MKDSARRYSKLPNSRLLPAARFGDLIIGRLLLIGLGLLFLQLFLHGLCYSLGVTGLLSKGLTTRFWAAAMSSPALRQSLQLSALIASAVTAISLSGSLLFTLLRYHSGSSRLIESALWLAMAVPVVVAATLTRFWLAPGGLIARLLYHCGLLESPTSFPALINDPCSIGIILCGTCCSMPLLTLFQLRIQEADGLHRYVRTAVQLGASRWQAFLHVLLPMLLQRSRGMLALTFLWNFSAWEAPLLLGQQSPRMISVLIQKSSGEFSLDQRPLGFVYSTVYFIVGVLTIAAFAGKAARRE